MYHRWPESANTWISVNKNIWFGHIRLSIVDPDPRSNQPFSIEEENYVITFNWEIYNYEELRNFLIKKDNILFKTTCDTEVLIYMYKKFWKNMLQYLQWMFTFCVFDKRKDELFIASDFVGQKPFVYIEDISWFYFASEIPALFELYPYFKKEIDYATLKLYFIDNLNHIPNNFCIFKGISKLENATYMIVKNGKIIEKKRYTVLKKNNFKSKENEISFLYKKLELMKPRDIDYASFLSWWIDSSFVCSGLKKSENSETDAYTLKIGENDEDFNRAKYVAKKLQLNHLAIQLDKTDFLKSIDDSIKILWEPYFHITSIFADEILKKVKEKHKVIFSWGGWDECYYWYNNLLFLVMDCYFIFKKILPLALINFIDKVTKKKYSTILYSTKDTFKENYFIDNFKRISHIFQWNELDKEAFKKISLLISDFKTFVEYKTYIDFSYMFWLFIENMHSLVIQGDLIGMKNSIEVRTPFLERDVIERAYSIPLRKKINILNLKEWKEILKKQLIRLFGRNFIYSKKIGFGVQYDFKQLFQKEYSNIINKKIDNLLQRNIFNEIEIKKILHDFKGNFFIIMKLYTLEIWFESFMD